MFYMAYVSVGVSFTGSGGTPTTTLYTYTYATSTNTQRQYIGEYYQPESELSYLNARWMDPDRGQFLSQDPAVLVVDPSLLTDPQQLNFYSYARNNPLFYKDTNGEKVEIVSRPVLTRFDSHFFYLVTPDNPSEININGLPAGTEKFTIGGYNRGGFMGFGNKLEKEIGYVGGPNNTDQPYLTGEKTYTHSVVITPPNGQSDSDFINALGEAYEDIDSVSYFLLGQRGKFGYGNSNNFVYDLGVRVGVADQISSFNPSFVYHPGSGRALPTGTFLGYVKSQLDAIQAQVDKLVQDVRSYVNQ